ncbi:DUF1365 domain-containing protein [Halarcobacter mediterraneus]|uniref:DUF1365 domain-containing protein n=1 Tax=Halarcobacter mediterraneus TaxID=2023153 RepID=A0A4Q1B7V1_9BACT|nr:DUF1365 domain-containing protein [Halarcobacter mediterraneus]RXK14679.1 DUF1365 domain-containing protein [Halarcobacter mediterraneus]
MKHLIFDGMIYHKRFLPKEHSFKYKFFMLDIDLSSIKDIKNKVFSYNKFNLFSFYSKDHFGNKEDFLKNIDFLLKSFAIKPTQKMRFLTLPRIAGFVFNPISALILFEDNKPSFLIAEVHNYNGGRVIYPVELTSSNNKIYKGRTKKDMYVSPFFKRDGDYEFTLVYNEKDLNLSITLFEDEKKKLTSNFTAKAKEFTTKNLRSIFFKHTFLTFWVVTRTIYQSIKLKLLGLKWNKPIEKDTVRRY